jgi:hypothetical protein
VRITFGLFWDLVIRTIIIVAVTDILVFYFLRRNPARLTPIFVFEVIVVTIIPLVINIWFVIYELF